MLNFKSNCILLLNITVACLCLTAASISVSQAEDLYITDDYLRGLSDEVSDPVYIKKAKEDLILSEQHEKDHDSDAASDVRKALISRFNFETLIRTKYPSTHNVYVTLPTSARILIYDEFKNSKKLSTAKRLIIERYSAN